jgi:hypothetical protein
VAAMQLNLSSRALASDTSDLEPGNAKIVELAIRENGKLSNSRAIKEISAHFSEDD